MSEEISPNDVVSFIASIPPSSSAIKINGEAQGGGTITLLVPGSDERGLLQMMLLRGKWFLVTAAILQTELPLASMPEEQERLFPPATVDTATGLVVSLSDSAIGANIWPSPDGIARSQADLDEWNRRTAEPSFLPDHVHTFGIDGRCMAAGCTYWRESVFPEQLRSSSTSSSASSLEGRKQEAKRPRRVRRGALARAGGRKRSKA